MTLFRHIGIRKLERRVLNGVDSPGQIEPPFWMMYPDAGLLGHVVMGHMCCCQDSVTARCICTYHALKDKNNDTKCGVSLKKKCFRMGLILANKLKLGFQFGSPSVH